MITAAEAKRIAYENGKEKAIEKCKKWTKSSICEAAERGLTNTCLAYTSAPIEVNGKIEYFNCEDEIKTWLRSLGYRFKPTGYCGGVWQDSEEICWG